MTTFRRSSNHDRLVATGGIVTAVVAILVVAALLAPGGALARADEPDQAGPSPVQASSPPPPPPALQLNPPTATPEPGAANTSASTQGGNSDLEAIRFRPKVSLQRGESTPVAAAEKPASTAHPNHRKQPLGAIIGPQEAYQAPDVAGLLSPLDWTPLLYENFVGFSPPALEIDFQPWYGTSVWTIYDFSNDGYDRSWGANNWTYYHHEDDPSDNQSTWPAAAGPDALDPNDWYYPDNLNSWLDYGPLDLSNMDDVFVSFGLWYDTEPGFDPMYFCASIDGNTYSCDYWSGYSDGWTDQAYWLTSYAGYSQVWLAWVFKSDFSNGANGPFVDEIWAWGYDISAPPPPLPTPDPEGELVLHGSFETGDLTEWDAHSWGSLGAVENEITHRPSLQPRDAGELGSSVQSAVRDALGIASVGVTDATAVDGQYAAYLWDPDIGSDFLYQTMVMPSGITDVVLNFWFGVTTYETQPGSDWFCVSMSDPNDHADIWVDLGCMDAYYTTGHWQRVLYAFDDEDMQAIAGKPEVDLVFELYNRGDYGTGSAGWVDYVSAYATGGGGGSSIDPNEPNDSAQSATAIACGDTISGTIGDAVGSYGDLDVFVLRDVPPGQLDIDIRADTQVPPSALDSVVGLWASEDNLLTWNDDDSASYDSYITYTIESAGTFYVSVESYSGYGGPDSFYDLTVQCAGSGGGPPGGGSEQPPEQLGAWTLMLYLNAEDRNFEQTLRGYIRDMQTVLNGKTDFLTVTVLYDGPNDGDTVRYLLQPDGAYENGVNRWPMGERNMGDPETLAAFANWSMDQYPAEKTYLAVDDHGHGVYGISWDQTNGNDALTPPELYSALKNATNNGARKIDILDYEACLMGMAETAYDVREWVNFVVFFEQISWGIDTYPVYFDDLGADDTPLAVGEKIVNRYHDGASAAGYPHTISFINTGRMAEVKQAVTDLGDALTAADDRDGVNNARDNSQAFAADNDATNPLLADYIDLWDLANNTASLSGAASTAAAGVKTAVENAVVHEQHTSDWIDGFWWDHSGVHGLSIYYPASNASSAFRDYTEPRLFRMSTDESEIPGKWDEFLVWAVTRSGNGTGDGLGGGDRKGMSAGRFLQPKLGGDKLIYLPLVLRQ
jgi:hypothetical protein